MVGTRAARLLIALIASVALSPRRRQFRQRRFPEVIPLPDGWQPEGITSGPGAIVYSGSR